MTLFHVRLELARSKDFPDGSSLHGYEFTAPLDASGHLDASGWKANKAACTVRRFTRGEPDERGRLVHVGKGWHFDYDAKDTDDDEPVFKLDRHTIKQGEYLSITENDGVMRTFKIASVRAVD
ncbi:MAG: hypothetical protein ABL996_20525 [Micropepsaceae bacterium]